MRNYSKEILLNLISINSESGNEIEIGNFITNRLESKFQIVKQEVNNNFNIFAYIGNPKILLAAHLDTVPGNLEITEDQEYVYGRGACDTKSQIAAMVLAGEQALKEGLTDFGLLFTVQEETDFAGAKKAIELIPDSVDFIVYGEPTDLYLVSGQKGLVSLKLTARGKKAHGSIPEKGINAIELLIEDLKSIKELNIKKDEHIGSSTLNIGLINGGTAMNTVPDYAESYIEIRNTVDPKIILEQIKNSVKNSEIEIINFYEPIFNEEAEGLALKLGLNVKTVPYFTEAYFFKNKKTIVLGAGKEEDAHSDKERIKIEDFNKLIEIYFNILSKSK